MTRLSLDEARSAREVARDALKTQADQVKADYAARGIPGRVFDSALGEARKTGREAAAIARESKGVIAATVAALGLWTFRRPIIDGARRAIDALKDKLDD